MHHSNDKTKKIEDMEASILKEIDNLNHTTPRRVIGMVVFLLVSLVICIALFSNLIESGISILDIFFELEL